MALASPSLSSVHPGCLFRVALDRRVTALLCRCLSSVAFICLHVSSLDKKLEVEDLG